MKYTFLDPSKTIQVSKICLGTMTWGVQNTEAEAHEQLEYAMEKGINFIDTAEIYAVPPSQETYGKTETYIGSWLRRNKPRRADLVIASKMAGPGHKYIREGRGLKAKDVMEAIDGSLHRLQTDYLDLYQLHWPDRKVNYFGMYNYNPDFYNEAQTLKDTEEMMLLLEALAAAVRQGKIRHVGVSNETPWGVFQYKQLQRAGSTLPPIITIQNVYNLVSRAFDLHLSEVCMKEQVGLLAYSPLAGGLLSGKYRNNVRPEGARFSTWGFRRMERYDTPSTLAATEAYASLAEKFGLSPSIMALAFVNHRAFVVSNIIGATTMTQLKENIASIDITLTQEIYSEIERIFMMYRNPAA